MEREEAKKWLEEMKKGYMPWSDEVLNAVLDIAISALSADARPNIHGHWINHVEHCESIGAIPSGLGAYEWCSNCDCGIDVMEWHRNNYNYCPNCGADMREPIVEKGTE